MPISSLLRLGLKPTTAGRTIRRSRPRGSFVRATLERLEDRIQPTGAIGTPLNFPPVSGSAGYTVLQDTAALSDSIADPIGQTNSTIDWGDGTPVASGSVILN